MASQIRAQSCKSASLRTWRRRDFFMFIGGLAVGALPIRTRAYAIGEEEPPIIVRYNSYIMNIDPISMQLRSTYDAAARRLVIHDHNVHTVYTAIAGSLLASGVRLNDNDPKYGVYSFATRTDVVPFIYDRVDLANDGMSRVRQGEDVALLSSTGGQLVALGEYLHLGVPGDGMCAFSRDTDARRFGFVNESGDVVIEPRLTLYHSAPFSDGRYLLHPDDPVIYMDRKGETVIEINDANGSIFSEGVARISSANGDERRSWHINSSGLIAIGPHIGASGDFRDGFAPASDGWPGIFEIGNSYSPIIDDAGLVVLSEHRFGVIDRNGRFVVDPIWEEVGSPASGMIAVRRGRKWGFVDVYSGHVIAPLYDDVGQFTGPIAPVTINSDILIIDRQGRVVMRPELAFGFRDQ